MSNDNRKIIQIDMSRER